MWMKTFIAECTYDGVVVATALARYIDREGVRSEFWGKMEVPSEDMCDIAFQVFDRYGTIKAKYKDHPVQRESGVWGNELNYGPLFLFEELHVAAELRRKGLGHKVASLLLDKAKQFCLEDKPDSENADLVYGSNQAFERAWTLHALVNPGILTANIKSQLAGKSVEERLMIRTRVQFGAIYFWRACGFRRIGASRCFAFSYDSQHPSHTLDAASDFDPRRDYSEDPEDEERNETSLFTQVKQLRVKSLRSTLPLHHAALTLADDELKEFFMTHASDDIGWDRVANSGATLLHLTACKLKPLSTRWLLENVPNSDSWKTARNLDGYTPLEALREDLETMRTQKEVNTRILNLSDHFKGYPDTAVSCLSLLSGPDTLRLSDACLRYGYTCGECLEGFISARMSSALIFQGETTYDLIQEGIDDGSFWVKDNDYLLIHLDHDVRRNLRTNKSFRKGFANIFRIAVDCLKANRVPTAESLEWCCNNRSEWPPDTKNYMRRSGTAMGCRAVLRYMFDAAKEEDEKAGNGECQLVLKEAWSDLPTCRNDHEFEFVARACGYGGDDFISLPMW
jgi:GNAT superfamily N-acetyltransferase